MRKVIHYCWFGGKPLSDTAEKSLASWKRFAPGFVADYARFKVLHEYGGIYMDVGSELIRDITPLLGSVPFTAIEESSLTATTGLIVAVEPHDPIIGACVARYESMQFSIDPVFLDKTTVNEVFTAELETIGFRREDKEQSFGGWRVMDSRAFNPVYGFGGYHIKPCTYSIHRSSGSWVECSPFIGRRPAQILGRVLMEVSDGGLIEGSKRILGVAREKVAKGRED